MKTQNTLRRAAAQLTVAIIAALLICALPSPAAGQSRAQRIAVVDVDRIMHDSMSFKSASRKIEEGLQPLKDKYTSKVSEQDQLRQSLRDRRSVLKPEDISAQEQKYFALVDEVNDLNYSIDKESSRLQREILEPIMKRLKDVIENIAREQGYDLVLYANQVIFFSEQSDLTSLVLQGLDRSQPSAADVSAQPTPAPSAKKGTAKTTTKKSTTKKSKSN